MGSQSIEVESLIHAAVKEEVPSKKPRTHSPFQRILPELLPSILSYIPTPHLHYRLVNKEWDNAMKIVHSFGHCDECVVHHCASFGEVHTRMQELAWQLDGQQKVVPWMLHWSQWISYLPHGIVGFEEHVIRYLDSLQSSHCCFINLIYTKECDQETASLLANWCLEHSKLPKYSFRCSFSCINFVEGQEFSSFLRAPSMKHVAGLVWQDFARYPDELSLRPFRDSHTVSNLQSLSLQDISLTPHDAQCLLSSQYLTNLTHLTLNCLDAEHMNGEDRKIGFDTIICSPIMTKLKSFVLLSIFHELGYCVFEAFAQSKYLKNLTELCIGGIEAADEWSLKPLSGCDATMPHLTSFTLDYCFQVPKAAMAVISSSSSALFNQIESLNFTASPLPIESMEILCASEGLRALKKLNLDSTDLKDEHIQLLASAAPSCLKNLQDLNLYSNSALTNESVLAIHTSKNLPKLQRINFKNCWLLNSKVFNTINELPPPATTREFLFDGNF